MGIVPDVGAAFDVALPRETVYQAINNVGDIASGNVIVLGEEGLSTAAGVAELLAQGGAKVELVTRWQMVIPRLQGNGQFAFVMPRLYAAGVTLSPNTYVKEIGDHAITLFNIFTNEERVVDDVGAVVLVASRKPNNQLVTQLAGHVGELHVVGDASAPRTLSEATYEGQQIGRAV